MKNLTKSFKVLSVLTLVIAGFILFQGQDAPKVSDENNPNIDRPVRTPNFNVYHNNIGKDIVVTDAFGYDNFNLGTNFAEVHQSINTTNPIGMFNAFNTNGGWWTNDGWTFNAVTPPFPNTAGDPWTAYDSLGNLYYITLNSNVSGTWVLKSTNNGQTWGTPVAGCTGNDRETMACDQTGGPYANYIYCGETPGNFSRSTDGGVSFTQTASMSNTLPGFMMAVGPGPTGISGGAVYVITSTGVFSSPTYTIYRSTDGGASFTNMSTQSGWVNVVGTIVGGRNSYQNMRLRPYPFIYADNSYGTFRGRLYIFFCGNNPPGDGNKPDVYVRYSSDGGATFSAAVTINDDANTTLNAQFHPAAWCDKQTGKLYCQWMDTRNTPTADSAEIYASLSTDGGVTWQTNQKISTAKMRITCPSCGGGGTPAYQGDYNGMGSNNKVGLAAWTDFRAGTFGSYVAYFPDYAMKVNQNTLTVTNFNDSVFSYASIPGVKLYSGAVKFTAVITPPPSAGILAVNFLNRTTNALLDSLTSFPDSVKVRIRATGGVTNGAYVVSIYGKGPNGTPVHKRDINLTVTDPIGIISNTNEVPEKFYLFQNYPNPFNPSTYIKLDIAKTGLVKMNVYNINGQLVSALVNQNLNAGSYTVDFDAKDLASGVYFYKLETGDFTSIRKMIVLK